MPFAASASFRYHLAKWPVASEDPMRIPIRSVISTPITRIRRRCRIWIGLAICGRTRTFIVLSFICCGLTTNIVPI